MITMNTSKPARQWQALVNHTVTLLFFMAALFSSSTPLLAGEVLTPSPKPAAQAAKQPSSASGTQAEEEAKAAQPPRVLLTTNMGDIIIELNQEKAPISVENFLHYVDSGFYNDTSFHRVIKDFMVQGGGFDLKLQKKATRSAIKNEAKNGLKNIRGSIAMARTQVVDSATAQFFLNLSDNNFLDHGVRDFGYAVFGQVVKGMDVVERIGKSSTTVKNRMRDVPQNPIYIKEAKRL